MAARSLHNQKVVGSNPAGSYETAISKLMPYCLLQHVAITCPDINPKSEPAHEQYSRAAPSVEAHHHSVNPDTGRNSVGRRILKKYTYLY